MSNIKFEKATNEKLQEYIRSQIEIKIGNVAKQLANAMCGFEDCIARKDIEGMKNIYDSIVKIAYHTKEEELFLADAIEVVANKILEMKREEV